MTLDKLFPISKLRSSHLLNRDTRSTVLQPAFMGIKRDHVYIVLKQQMLRKKKFIFIPLFLSKSKRTFYKEGDFDVGFEEK